ncbi:MAG TPA: hypothetical protein VM074_08130 [Solimonas sp.]|nr:hypothetical protein [Solimonas sp.]
MDTRTTMGLLRIGLAGMAAAAAGGALAVGASRYMPQQQAPECQAPEVAPLSHAVQVQQRAMPDLIVWAKPHSNEI